MTDLPQRINPYYDLSREELEKRLWNAEFMVSSLKVKQQVMDEVMRAFRIIKDVADHYEEL